MVEFQVRWLEAAAAQNQPDALYNMAVMHAYGHGGAAQDNQLAREYFERAAALDFAPAKNGLAMLLSNSGGEKEYQEAFKLFNESAALGNSDGHFNKGILLRQGLGVAKDPVAARVALQAAADLGHPTACVTLAEMLVSGEGGPDDHIGALVLLKLISALFRSLSIRNGQNWSCSQRRHQIFC
jgi:TPR repeat protein